MAKSWHDIGCKCKECRPEYYPTAAPPVVVPVALQKFDVLARNGCHGNDPEIKKSWTSMGTFEAQSASDAARAVFDDVKAKYPENWAAWTIDDFKARPVVVPVDAARASKCRDGIHSFGPPASTLICDCGELDRRTFPPEPPMVEIEAAELTALRSRLTAVEQQHLEANRRYAELWDEVASVRQERDELAARIRRMSL